MPNDVLNSEPPKPTLATADDVNDFLNSDEPEVEAEAEPTVRKTKTKVEPEESEEEESEETSEDEELELVDPDEETEKLDLEKPEDDIEIAAPPRKKEILAKYPNIFKDFPFMEKVLYRDRQYTELFGSFDDAKELASKGEVFSEFENQLLAGNTVEILKNVKETDSKAFDKIVDNYLKNLASVDKDAYFEVVGNVIKQAILEMSNEDNDELKEAAALINKWMGWGNKLTPPKSRVEEKPANEEAEKERLAIVQERFIGARDTLQTQADNTLKATINEYIDPKGVMTGYIKKNAIKDTLDNLGEEINKDPSFRKNLDSLWRAAFDARFSQESLNKIKRFYLGRAKSLLPRAIVKARAEALKDLATKPREKEVETEEREETPRRRGPIPAGGPSRPKKNEMKKGESVSEFFARD